VNLTTWHVVRFTGSSTVGVGRTVTDARSQLSANRVESVELLKWGLNAGLI